MSEAFIRKEHRMVFYRYTNARLARELIGPTGVASRALRWDQQEYDPNANLKAGCKLFARNTRGRCAREGVFFPGRGGTTKVTTLRFETRTSVDGAARCGRCG